MNANPAPHVHAIQVPKSKQARGLRKLERQLRPKLRSLRWRVVEQLLSWRDPDALAFYNRAMDGAFLPNERIDIVPKLNLFYVAVPKAASSRIRSNLAAMVGQDTVSDWRADQNWRVHNRKASTLQAPRHSVTDFYRTATDPAAFRFTFVRNPYARLLSCWADQYRDRPLTPGYGRVELYLAYRDKVSNLLPVGPDATLSFADFVRFCCATAEWRIDRHWELQSTLVDIPGVDYELVGKTESFATDFVQVLDHVNADDALRKASMPPLHSSARRQTADYVTPDLADLIFQTYERDFDRFQYRRLVPE